MWFGLKIKPNQLKQAKQTRKKPHYYVAVEIICSKTESISLSLLPGITYMFNFSQVRICTSLCSILKAEIF